MGPGLEYLNATQRRAVELAAMYPQDEEAAAHLERSKHDFHGILEDACLAAGISGDSFAERRSRLVDLYHGKAPAREPDANEPSAHSEPAQNGAQPKETNMPTLETVQKRLKKVQDYLRPAMLCMAQGMGRKQIAKHLAIKETITGVYMSRISSALGLVGLPLEEKASILKQLDLTPGAKEEKTARAAKANGAHTPAKKPAAAKKQGTDLSLEKDLEALSAFGDTLQGGGLAEAIKRIVARYAEYEKVVSETKAAIEALKRFDSL